MSIESWSIFWKIVFIIGVSTFAILSVLVIFGGAKDIAPPKITKTDRIGYLRWGKGYCQTDPETEG
jgi:hypothetical protein